MPDPVAFMHPAQLPQRGGGRLSLPNQFPLTGEEKLRITTVNSLAGVNVVVQGRLFDDAGNSKWFRYVTTPNTDRTIKTTDFPLTKGVIGNLVAFVEGAAPLVGQTAVQVRIVIGTSGATFLMATLVQGYVTAGQELAWPGSPIQNTIDGGGYVRTIAGTQPAPGIDLAETCPTGARWELVGFQATLVTSAVPGMRLPTLTVTTNVGMTMFACAPGGIDGSAVVVFAWCAGIGHDFAPPAGQLIVQGVSPRTPVMAGQSILTNTGGIDVDDQWFLPVYSVREWLEF